MNSPASGKRKLLDAEHSDARVVYLWKKKNILWNRPQESHSVVFCINVRGDRRTTVLLLLLFTIGQSTVMES